MTWLIVQLVALMLSAVLVIVWVNWEAIMTWRYDRQITDDLDRRFTTRWIRGRV